MYVELIVQELTRMGIYYAKQDIYRRKIERVKIRSTKALPDQIEIEINTDDLPKWITTAHLANPDTVHSLGMVCGRKISVIDEEEKGFWYVIPR